MAIKSFAIGDLIDANTINTYMANGGLTYITQKTATSGTVVNFDSCFSATYDSYTIVISDLRSASTVATWLKLRTGTTDISANYQWAAFYLPQGSNPATLTATNGGASPTFWELGTVSTTNASGCVVHLANPYLAVATTMSCMSIDARTSAGALVRQYGGVHTSATSYDGFTFSASGTTLTNVNIRLYGNRMQ